MSHDGPPGPEQPGAAGDGPWGPPPAGPPPEQPGQPGSGGQPSHGQQPGYGQQHHPPYGSPGYGPPPGYPAYGRPGYPTPYGYVDPLAKSKLAAGLLGIFLGGFGVHRFYLGYTRIGVIQIVVTVFTCGLGSIWGFVEGILYLAGASGWTTDATGRPLKE